MSLDLASSRQRAISRRSLLLLLVALALAAACQVMPAIVWKAVTNEIGVPVDGAPPEAATRPNPSTEPVRGPGRD